MRVRSSRDVSAGAVVVAIATAVLASLSRIPATKYQAIAPDLFPRVCACALVVAGLALVVRGFVRDGPAFEWPAWRGVVLVTAGVVAFGLAAPRFGYAVAGLLTIVLSGLASRGTKPWTIAAFAVAMIAFSVVLFTYVLKVPMPPFAWRVFGA